MPVQKHQIRTKPVHSFTPHTYTSPFLSCARGKSSKKEKKRTYWQRWEHAKALRRWLQLVGPAYCTLRNTKMSPVSLILILGPPSAGEKVNSSETNGFAYRWQMSPDCDLNKHFSSQGSDGISPMSTGIRLWANFKVFLESNWFCSQPGEAPLGVFVLTTTFKLIKFEGTRSHFQVPSFERACTLHASAHCIQWPFYLGTTLFCSSTPKLRQSWLFDGNTGRT